jgi:hypothetical protein
MPTQLTNPIQTQITHATLDGWELVVVRNSDLSVNVGESYIIADFAFRSAGGIVERKRLTRRGTELPAQVTSAIANLQSVLITASRSAGLLPAGSDTPDF